MNERFWRILCFLIGSTVSFGGELSVSACGEFKFEDKAVVGLSGLTWAGGNQFYAASDRLAGYVPLTIQIDSTTGKITDAKSTAPVTVNSTVRDCEGIAWNARTKTLWLGAEVGPAVIGFPLQGSPIQKTTIPPVFASFQRNLGLESLTYNETVNRYWIANEETLKADAPVETNREGAIVRLQEFDGTWKPLRQFSWRTEVAGMRIRGIGNGVSDLCLLPDGKLLVLERGFGALTLQSRLFLADFAPATSTMAMPSLKGKTIQPVGKKLLFTRNTAMTNYEGIALGPVLSDGSRSLILIADSADGHIHSLLALRLHEEPMK